MKKIEHKIKEITPGSILEELGIESGDFLLTINEQWVQDVINYNYLTSDGYLEIVVKKENGEEWLLEIEKELDEELGAVFDNSLMSHIIGCHNDCTFCFVAQMPPNLRETLYVKDDDYRLSFLQGNYITLTNLTDSDVERIISNRLEPLNISVQTMNPILREKMLRNKNASTSLNILERFFKENISINAQIVLCKGHNDGEELVYSIEQLKKYLPVLKSLTIVPVGLSKHREDLMTFDAFTEEEAANIVDLVESYQESIYKDYGYYCVQASDEWYSMAGRDVPKSERYDGFTQLENGVGMLRLLFDEVVDALSEVAKDIEIISVEKEITLATGLMTAPYIQDLANRVMSLFPNLKINVHPINNDFFGEQVTVAGLITGTDLINQLKGKELGHKLILPIHMLRTNEQVFLDDLTVEEVEAQLACSISIVESDGKSFVDEVLFDNSNSILRDNEKIHYVSGFVKENN